VGDGDVLVGGVGDGVGAGADGFGWWDFTAAVSLGASASVWEPGRLQAARAVTARVLVRMRLLRRLMLMVRW